MILIIKKIILILVRRSSALGLLTATGWSHRRFRVEPASGQWAWIEHEGLDVNLSPSTIWGRGRADVKEVLGFHSRICKCTVMLKNIIIWNYEYAKLQ